MRIPKTADNFEYWDLRVLKNNSETLSVEDNTINALNVHKSHAVGLRVTNKGAWVFVSSNKLDLKELFSKALKLSKIRGVKIQLPNKRVVKKNYKSRFRINPSDEPAENKIKTLKELNSLIKDYSKEIRTAQTFLSHSKRKKIFEDSLGSRITSTEILTRYMTKCVAVKNGALQQAFERNYITGGLEALYGEDLNKIASTVGERVVRLLHAKHAPPKKLPIICDPYMTGVFFHEAVGHACEADAVIMNASVLKGKIGHRVASDVITFSDYSGPSNSFGRTVFDDEGVRKKETVLIKKGVLKNYLQSLHTAAVLRTEPTGNGRSMSPEYFPLPRMTTLKVRAGNFSEEELVASVRNGVLVKGFRGGEVNPTEGKFVFAASEAFMIENGKITTPLRDVTISGDIQKTMNFISGVSRKTKLTDGGVCGKASQHIPVSEIVPWIRIDEVLVGGRDS
jgi:TldD protein